MGSGDGGGRGAARGGRGPPREKDVLVAAGEVVGRPLAVWSQKLLDWPKARIGGWRPETREHLVKFDSPPGEGQPAEQWVRLGSVRFQWLAEQPESAAPNPTAAGAPKGDNCVGRRLKVFWWVARAAALLPCPCLLPGGVKACRGLCCCSMALLTTSYVR